MCDLLIPDPNSGKRYASIQSLRSTNSHNSVKTEKDNMIAHPHDEAEDSESLDAEEEFVVHSLQGCRDMKFVQVRSPFLRTNLQFLLCWSVPHNWGRLITDVGGNLKFFNGVRVFAMLYVLLGHTVVFLSVSAPVWNPTYIVYDVCRDRKLAHGVRCSCRSPFNSSKEGTLPLTCTYLSCNAKFEVFLCFGIPGLLFDVQGSVIERSTYESPLP